jgi:hypothetical protein
MVSRTPWNHKMATRIKYERQPAAAADAPFRWPAPFYFNKAMAL